MRRATTLTTALFASLVLAACSGSTSATPSSAAPAASEPAQETTAPASAAASAAADACAPSTDSATVTVEIANFEYAPAEATAKVGDVVNWTNSDSAPHTATLDDGACGTGNIPSGGSGALVFNTAGTFPYHCAVHPNMKATITVTE